MILTRADVKFGIIFFNPKKITPLHYGNDQQQLVVAYKLLRGLYCHYHLSI